MKDSLYDETFLDILLSFLKNTLMSGVILAFYLAPTIFAAIFLSNYRTIIDICFLSIWIVFVFVISIKEFNKSEIKKDNQNAHDLKINY